MSKDGKMIRLIRSRLCYARMPITEGRAGPVYRGLTGLTVK
jgi:hypothetical protein